MGKKQEENFDVTMGTYAGAVVCEIICIVVAEEICLYRDDGLSVNTKNVQTKGFRDYHYVQYASG